MNNLDQWILVVIACVAVVSPCITTYLNNRHQRKLAKLNTSFTLAQSYIDEFFESLGNYISGPNMFHNRKQYLSSMFKLHVIGNSETMEILNTIDVKISTRSNWDDINYLHQILKDDLVALSKNLNECLNQYIN